MLKSVRLDPNPNPSGLGKFGSSHRFESIFLVFKKITMIENRSICFVLKI